MDYSGWCRLLYYCKESEKRCITFYYLQLEAVICKCQILGIEECVSPWFSPHFLCESHTGVLPSPSEFLSVCPPGTWGWSSHCPAEHWTPWLYGTCPPLPLMSPERRQMQKTIAFDYSYFMEIRRQMGPLQAFHPRSSLMPSCHYIHILALPSFPVWKPQCLLKLRYHSSLFVMTLHPERLGLQQKEWKLSWSPADVVCMFTLGGRSFCCYLAKKDLFCVC